MNAIQLVVPRDDVPLVSEMGARCYEESGRWYVPSGIDPSRFSRWITHYTRSNLSCSRVYYARGEHQCEACDVRVPVFALVLPSGYTEVLDAHGAAHEVCRLEPAFIRDVEHIRESVAAELKMLSHDCYRQAFDRCSLRWFWRNHCRACDRVIDDESLFEIGGQAFRPVSIVQAERIHLFARDHDASVSGAAVGSPTTWWMPAMRMS